MTEVLEKRRKAEGKEESKDRHASAKEESEDRHASADSSSPLPTPPSAAHARLRDGGESSVEAEEEEEEGKEEGEEEEGDSEDEEEDQHWEQGGAILYECDHCGYRGSFEDVSFHEQLCRAAARVGKDSHAHSRARAHTHTHTRTALPRSSSLR